MSDAFEKTFVVRRTGCRGADAFADGEQRSQLGSAHLRDRPSARRSSALELPELECVGRVEEVQRQRLLRHTELTGPHANSEVTVTFEAVEGGTRITITHAGFGQSDAWHGALGGMTIGWDQAIADLCFFSTDGVPRNGSRPPSATPVPG